VSVYGRILVAGLGSLLLLAGALGSQYLGGLAPCPMCIWQRWPHVAAVLIALAATTVLWRWRRPLAGAGAATMAVGAGLGAYHAGVEQGWWSGPAGCSGVDPSGLTPDELLTRLSQTPLVRCDEIAWEFLGISMAGWNGLFSAGLALLWVFAALPRTPTRHVSPEDRARRAG
jgi:disulfide bond formation protein DsbB